MYLEKLEINGFKSFARKSVLEFKAGITAVVGPNGSGKSNVADAIRWVLGEQSIKMLRGKKSEDIIFSGSDKKARLGLAEVSLHFNNEDDQLDLGMSQIVITRKLYRNGESEYLINNQKSRLLDIQMILAKAGVANTSYSIIGQGQIDAFLLASKEDRKEFFEEASGVKPLQIKRAQALSKLEATEENLQTVAIQLSEIEPRLNSLTRQVKKLEQRTDLENNLRTSQFKYYGAAWQSMTRDWQKLNDELKKAFLNEESAKNQLQTIQQEMEVLTKGQIETNKYNDEYQSLIAEKIDYNNKLTDLKIKQAAETVSQFKEKKNNLPILDRNVLQKVLEKIKILQQKIVTAFASGNLEELKKLFLEQEQNLKDMEALLIVNDKKIEVIKEIKPLESKTDTEIKKILATLESIDEKIGVVRLKIQEESNKERQERSQIWESQQKYQLAQQKFNQATNSTNSLRIDMARLETHRDDLMGEITQELGQNFLDQSAKEIGMNESEKSQLLMEINRFKHQLDLIGGIDPEVASEYFSTKERFDFLSTQINDLKDSLVSLEKMILELDKTVRAQFEVSFKIINEEFQKYFKVLFAGGAAKLVLVKEDLAIKSLYNDNLKEEDFSAEILAREGLDDEKEEVQKIRDRLNTNIYSGVEIEATPPGKKLKSISMLSGGERAMTSIALLCAIISANPSPFVILDEVDAALDEANSVRYAEIVERLSNKSQFIIITHNRATMEKAGLLYGVTMGDDGVSTLLSLALEGAEKYTNR
ncbi:MAG TPA: AAA family ATPase [bacterium]|nr:AAA family ATPase [bacterium]